MEEKRKQLVDLIVDNKLTIAELCRQFDISRPTAYIWLDRFNKEGIEGLKNRSCAPRKQANLTAIEIEDELLAVKFTYPDWGPKKVKATLEREMPSIDWPSTTTIGNIFSRNGLTIPRKLRIRMADRTAPLIQCQQSNDI